MGGRAVARGAALPKGKRLWRVETGGDGGEEQKERGGALRGRVDQEKTRVRKK